MTPRKPLAREPRLMASRAMAISASDRQPDVLDFQNGQNATGHRTNASAAHNVQDAATDKIIDRKRSSQICFLAEASIVRQQFSSQLLARRRVRCR